MKPDFSSIPYDAAPCPRRRGSPKRPPLTPEGIAVKPVYTAPTWPASTTWALARGRRPTCAGPTPACTCGTRGPSGSTRASRTAEESNAFYRRNLAGGQKGPERGLRPGHPPRLRLRPPARGGRRGQGRRGHRLGGGHENPLRPDSARPDVGVDDHERGGAARAGLLHRGGRGAGRGARKAGGHHSERHSEGVHGAQHLHLPARAEHAHHRRHLRLHGGADAQVQLHLHLGLPHAGGRRHRRPGAGLHPGRRPGVRARRPGRGHED